MRPSSDNHKSRREWRRLQASTVPGTARNTRHLWLVVDNATYESQSDVKALVASFPTRPLGSDPVSTYTQNGDVLFRLEHYEEALITYEQVLQLDPANSYAANCSGNALYKLGRFERAHLAYQQATQLDPQEAIFHYNQGCTLACLDRHEEALAAFEQAIRLDPSDAYAHNNAGNALYRLHRYERSLAAYERAIQLDPDQTPLAQSLITRSGRPCGLFFQVQGPRMVKTYAVWAGEEGRILFYDSQGVRFAQTRLSEGPDPRQLA